MEFMKVSIYQIRFKNVYTSQKKKCQGIIKSGQGMPVESNIGNWEKKKKKEKYMPVD